MKVIRIVPNIKTETLEAAKHFYADTLGLDILMDLGWIVTFGAPSSSPVQISVLTEGGSGMPVPHASVEVDDLDEALHRMRDGGYEITYGPVHEPWGVRRFFVRDPSGKIVNILAHD